MYEDKTELLKNHPRVLFNAVQHVIVKDLQYPKRAKRGGTREQK
jgi:hypothetical protein